jgi:hypothetical protein
LDGFCQAGNRFQNYLSQLHAEVAKLHEKIIPTFEKAHGPGYQVLIMVDNSQGHSAYPDNALLVSKMNLNPGGKQAHLWDGWFICDGQKITQSMVFPAIIHHIQIHQRG